MAKAGMRRYEELPHDENKGVVKKRPKNDVEPVPELQGKAKESNEKAKPLIKNR